MNSLYFLKTSKILTKFQKMSYFFNIVPLKKY